MGHHHHHLFFFPRDYPNCPVQTNSNWPSTIFLSLFSKCPHVSKRPQQPDKTCQQHSSLISMYYKQLTTYINLLALFYLSRWLWTDLVLSKFHFLIPGNQRMKWIICCWMMEDSSFFMASDRIVIIVIQRMIGYELGIIHGRRSSRSDDSGTWIFNQE
jgi:hypothetical protein